MVNFIQVINQVLQCKRKNKEWSGHDILPSHVFFIFSMIFDLADWAKVISELQSSLLLKKLGFLYNRYESTHSWDLFSITSLNNNGRKKD